MADVPDIYISHTKSATDVLYDYEIETAYGNTTICHVSRSRGQTPAGAVTPDGMGWEQ